MNPQRLYRSRADHPVAGICGGLATYFAIDVTLVRLFLVLAAVFTGGLMILIYFVMWLVIPVEPADYAESLAANALGGQAQSASGAEPGEAGAPGAPFGSTIGPGDWTSGFGWSRFPSDDRRRRRHQFVGWGLLVLGALILMSNLNLFSWLHLHDTWPLFLILAGLFLLLRRRE